MSGRRLQKQHTWSPDIRRNEAWSRRTRRHGRCHSITDDDIADLKACFELGFRIDSPQVVLNRKLSDTFPALHLLSRTLSTPSLDSLSSTADGGRPMSLFESGDDPEMKKTRLKQWAQVVACTVRQQLEN